MGVLVCIFCYPVLPPAVGKEGRREGHTFTGAAGGVGDGCEAGWRRISGREARANRGVFRG